MEIGDRINWRWSPRGGYAYIIPVAGVVLKIGKARLLIRVAQRTAAGWEQKTRWVNSANVSPRDKYVPEVDAEQSTKEEQQ